MTGYHHVVKINLLNAKKPDLSKDSFHQYFECLAITAFGLQVTEYGVHWNFFFSLAAVSLLSAFVSPLFNDSRLSIPGFKKVIFFSQESLAWLSCSSSCL